MIATHLNGKFGEKQNEIPVVSGLVKKKIDYDVKISDIEKRYFTIYDYNQCTSEVIDAKIKENGLVDKCKHSNILKSSDLNTKLATLITKAELKAEQDNMVKLQMFDSK